MTRDARTPTVAADARHLTRRVLRRLMGDGWPSTRPRRGVRDWPGRVLVRLIVALSRSERHRPDHRSTDHQEAPHGRP